ncbi:MAG: hypothetical protein ABJA78_04605 [Ferruginibacter sp.]
MKKICTLLLTVFSLTSFAQSPFTPGNLVVLRVGDGVGTLSAASAAVFLEERTPAGALVQTIAMPTTGTNQLTNAGSSGTEGNITRSQNGSFIAVPGYNATTGVAAIAGTTAASTNRVVNVIDNTGNIVNRVVSSTAFSGGNIRGAVMDGASAASANYWGSGSNLGILYLGAGTPATVSTTTTNVRSVNIFNNQLYYSTGSGTTGIYAVGTGLPTTTGTVSTNIIALTGTSPSPNSFVINNAGTVCYIADDRTTGGGILKYTYNGSAWVFAYAVISTPVRGIIADFSQSPAVIYATTTAASANTIIAVPDNGAGSTSSLVSTSATNTAFRGIVFAPAATSGAVINTLPGNFTNLTTNAGVASANQTYTLSASGLTPSSGSISVTGSAELELSTDGISFTGTPLSIPYSGGALANTTIYFRIKSSATQGAIAATITHSGGGAPNAVINVSGGVIQNYYNSKSNSGLTNPATWSTTTDGSGPSPSNFTGAYQYFNIISQVNANYSGVWDVSNATTSSRVIVGDGTNPMVFTILPGADSVTAATRVDVLNNATLTIQNNRRPFLNNLATGSTVDFAETGLTTADTIKVAAISYYNLNLTNGIKILASGTTTVRGNMTVNNVINFNGAPSPFSTINALGDVSFTGTSTFEALPSGDNARLTLKMNGPGPVQNLTSSGSPLLLFRIERDSTAACSIQLGASTNAVLGNNSGGGLLLTPANASLAVNANNLNFIGAGVSTAASNGKIDIVGGNITVAKSAGSANAGTLRFTPGSEINQLNIAFDPAFTRDSITVADSVLISGSLNLTKGKLVMSSGKIISMELGTSVTGGSSTSFVDGKLEWNTGATTGFIFPVGKGNNYRPVTVTPAAATASVYNAEYFSAPYSTLTVTAPLTSVSNTEYWDVSKSSGASATISLSLNGTAIPAATGTDEIVVAHFESGSWVSVNGTSITPGTATTGTAVSSVLSTFSPFTFGVKPAIAGTTYTFNGNGNWDNPANWSNNTVPPAVLPAGSQIVIDPSAGECVLNVTQTVSAGATLTVKTGKIFRIPGNLIQQ